jgi:hypothetical protein
MKERPIVRLAALALGLEQFISGVWAVADPSGWFKSYPGFGRAWVAADGVYDQHLAIDAGSGWLGVGAALIVAAVWAKREALQIALAAFLVEVIPHFLFHATHTSDRLGTVDNVLSIGGLAFMGAVAAVVLIETTWRRTRHATDVRVAEEVSA